MWRHPRGWWSARAARSPRAMPRRRRASPRSSPSSRSPPIASHPLSTPRHPRATSARRKPTLADVRRVSWQILKVGRPFPPRDARRRWFRPDATLAVRHVTLSVALARVTVAQEPAAGAPRRWLPSRPRRADISRGRPDNPAPGKVTSQPPRICGFQVYCSSYGRKIIAKRQTCAQTHCGKRLQRPKMVWPRQILTDPDSVPAGAARRSHGGQQKAQEGLTTESGRAPSSR